MDRITARYRWTYDVRNLGLRIHERTRRRERIISYISIPVLLLLIGVMLAWEGSLFAAVFLVAILAFAGGLGAFITVGFISPYLQRREFSNHPDADRIIEWTFEAADVTCSNGEATDSAPWSTLHQVTSTIYGFLVYTRPGLSFFIPNHAFDSPADIEAVKTLAREHAPRFQVLD